MASDAVRAVLNVVWEAIQPLGQPAALMGGLSLAAWNYIRSTRDVDILIAINREKIDDVVAVLRQHGCRPKKHPPLITVGDHSFAQFLYTPPDEFYDVQFDLLLAETELQKSAIARRVTRHVPGVNLPIDMLNCDDLILFKLIAGRIIDRADAAMLLRENREEIDFAYLQTWIKRQKLEPEYVEVWQEAFPGEPQPKL